jgi:hypothetical protein
VFFKVGQFVTSPPLAIPMKVTAIKGDQIECEWLDAMRHRRTMTVRADLLKPFKRSRPITVHF